jgi:hypothetical protein
VAEERAKLPFDPRWTALSLRHAPHHGRSGARGAPLASGARPAGFDAWRETSVSPQRQPRATRW